MKYFRLKELQQAFGENGRLMGGHDQSSMRVLAKRLSTHPTLYLCVHI